MSKLILVLFSSLLFLTACGGGGDDGGGGGQKDRDSDGVTDSLDEFPDDSSRATTITNAHRLLTQSTFGVTESELNNVVSIGVDAWVDKQLSMSSAYDDPNDSHKTHLQRTVEITNNEEPSINWAPRNGIFNTSPAPIWNVKYYQMSAWWENSLGHPTNTQHGKDQLRQRVAYSLSQLLVVSGLDPRLDQRGDSIAYYVDILAKNAFGNFRTLLGEVSRSATMGVYLTYQGNKKADPTKSTRPDENFARELIQLFTVGLYELNIDGSPNRDSNKDTYPDIGTNQVPTYTQNDVVELAKVMTGWDVQDNSGFGGTWMGRSKYAGQMEFHPSHHEDENAEGGDGQVTVLGKTFALNGGADSSGLDPALDVIFNHPNVAPFVSRSLIMSLITSNPSSAYIARIAKVFEDNGNGKRGDLKAVVKAIILDSEARDHVNQSDSFGKIKEPILVFTQLLRLFDVKPLDGWKGRADSTRGDGSSAVVNGVYTFIRPERFFGQGPLRSRSVFNFYLPDYVPRDNYFSANNFVSPVSQIQTDGNIINIHNRIAYFLPRYEKNKINTISNQTLAEFAENKSVWSQHLMIIDYSRELALFEQALENDNNGDFINIINENERGVAVDALLIHLDKLMLGNTMQSDYKSALKNYLQTSSWINPSQRYKSAHTLIVDAIRLISLSPAFMVQQ